MNIINKIGDRPAVSCFNILHKGSANMSDEGDTSVAQCRVMTFYIFSNNMLILLSDLFFCNFM
jgi:hypothetical protein